MSDKHVGGDVLSSGCGYINITKEEYDGLLQELKAAKTEKNKVARELRTIIKRNEIDKLNIETQIGLNNMVINEKQRQERYIRLLLESCPVVMFMFDEKLRFLLGTQSITSIIDIDDISILHGRELDSIVERYSPSVFTEEIIALIKNMVSSRGCADLETKREILTKENKKYEISMLPFHQDTGEFAGALVIMHDITEIMMSKDTIQVLRKKATYDGLTHIYNNAAFKELATEFMSTANMEEVNSCLLIIDIDFFKKVNDTYGHSCGDLVLQNTSNAVKGIIRSNDLFGRLGGEEFGVLITGVSESAAFQLAEKLRISVSQSKVQYQGKDISVTVSVGVSLSCPGQSYEALFDQADIALYQAKNNGRNMTVLYGKEL